jgi:hypothetical protein
MNDQNQSHKQTKNVPTKEPWYKKWWGIILTILFFPLIIPYLVWTKTTWKKWIKIAITIICFISLISILSDSNETIEPAKQNNTEKQATEYEIQKPVKNSDETNNSQEISKESNIEISEEVKEIKYREERVNALSLVQAYKIQKTINEGNLKFEVKSGIKLYDVFKLQKESGYLNSNGRWVVVKDESRVVVIYRSNALGESLNNPQWSVIDGNTEALNGTALKYTPELRNQMSEINEEGFSTSRRLYLRWMEIAEQDQYKKILDEYDFEAADKTEEEILGVVAKEFNVSVETADKMFIEGSTEEVNEIIEVNSKRGNILSDKELFRLLKEQGDLYVPES